MLADMSSELGPETPLVCDGLPLSDDGERLARRAGGPEMIAYSGILRV